MKEIIMSKMDIENEKEIIIDGYIHYHIEKNYGSDADGNRGVKRVFVDDVTDVKGYDQDMDDLELSPDLMERASEILTRKFLQ